MKMSVMNTTDDTDYDDDDDDDDDADAGEDDKAPCAQAQNPGLFYRVHRCSKVCCTLFKTGFSGLGL